MPGPRRSPLAALIATAVVVTIALGWAGWRLLDQQRTIDERQARDRLESAADALAASLLGKLADAGERLSGWVAAPSSALPAVDGAVVVGIGPDGVDVKPRGGLPFVPVATRRSVPVETVATLEVMEFDGRLERARIGYGQLARDVDPAVRAGALLRLGRVQRKTRDFQSALATYRELTLLGPVDSGDLPAELAGLHGQRSTYLAMADPTQADAVAQQILKGLDEGRWLLTRGEAELYREPFNADRPESWALAHALSEVWREADGRLPARGQRVLGGTDQATPRAVVLWRSYGTSSAAVVARVDRFFDLPAAPWPGSWPMPKARSLSARPLVRQARSPASSARRSIRGRCTHGRRRRLSQPAAG